MVNWPVPLSGLIRQAATPRIIANNAGGTAPENNGKFTYISNMTATERANQPAFSTANVAVGYNIYDEFLKAFNAYVFMDTPLIPNLVGGPAQHGWCLESYWNQDDVEALTPSGSLGNITYWQFPSVFEGFDQLVIKNTGTSGTVSNLTLTVGDNLARLIRGAGGVPGELGPQDSWTVTVPSGSAILVNLEGEDVSEEGSFYVSNGSLGDLVANSGVITIDTGDLGDAPGTLIYGENSFEAYRPSL